MMYNTKSIISNKLFKSFSILVSGSILSQLISILISPITTRLFTPEQMGEYTLIITAVSLFGPIICLKYDMSIVVAKEERETTALIKLNLMICLILSSIVSILYSLLVIGNDKPLHIVFISIIVIFTLLVTYGLNNILLAYNNKNSSYKLISSVTVIKSVVSNTTMLITGVLNLGVIGLVLSQVFGHIAGVKKQAEDIIKQQTIFRDINIEDIKHLIFKYRSQPIYNASSALINTSIYSSINIFIKNMYSSETLGLYSLSYRVLGIPFSVISSNIARIFFDSAAKELKTNNTFKGIYKKMLIALSVLVIPFILILAIIAPTIFSNVFGVEWYKAGLYVRLLAPMFGIRLIAESLTTSFILAKKQDKELIFQSTLMVGEVLIYFLVKIYKLKIEKFLTLISILYVVVYSTMIVYMNIISRNEEVKNE